MSMRLLQIARSTFNRFVETAKEKNIWVATATAIAAAKRRSNPSTRDSFDLELGIDTSAMAPLWALDISSPNSKFGIRYQTMEPSKFLAYLRAVPVDPREFTFIDLGCGKGRTLILAAREGFKSVMGVEFSPQLAAIARQNIARVGASAEVIECDASRYEFSDGNLLIYMYHPFGSPVLDAVIRNLTQWNERRRGTAYVVYANPACHERFESASAFEPLVSKDDLRIWHLGQEVPVCLEHEVSVA